MTDLKPKIVGDIDNIYNDNTATCYAIDTFVLSEGDALSGKLKNKFCNLEVLQKGVMYYLILTSGRVGDKNTNVTIRRLNSEVIVKDLYFKECAKRVKQGYVKLPIVSIYPNCSASTKDFVLKDNVIDKVEAEKKVRELKCKSKGEEVSESKNVTKEFKLAKEVEAFVLDIYKAAKTEVESKISIDLSTGRTPVGVLSIGVIDKGRSILDQLAKEMKSKEGIDLAKLTQFSNMYNSIIPRKLSSANKSWLLDTYEKIQEQYDLLDLLTFSLARAVSNSKDMHDIEKSYKGLNSDISIVKDKKVIADITQKISDEQYKTHKLPTKVKNIFEIDQKNAPKLDSSCGNVVSLFHGTRKENLVSVLSTSIKLPTNLGSKVVRTGSMFGPGVYFGAYSKALQYSTGAFNKSKRSNTYYILLCDIALGQPELVVKHKYYTKAPAGKHSVVAIGRETKGDTYIKGIGGTKDFKIPSRLYMSKNKYSEVLYNEYIVYNQNRYKIRYVVEVEVSK